jgi:hypothetical protein
MENGIEINKYHGGKIYKLTDPNYTKMYIGSTCQELSARLSGHRRNYRNGTCLCESAKLFDEFGLDNIKIELIEEIKCENKMQLLKREGHYIMNNNCINKRVAGRTPSESNKAYRETHQDKLKQDYKDIYAKNKENIKAKYKEKYICECGVEIRKIEKSRHLKTQKHKLYKDK